MDLNDLAVIHTAMNQINNTAGFVNGTLIRGTMEWAILSTITLLVALIAGLIAYVVTKENEDNEKIFTAALTFVIVGGIMFIICLVIIMPYYDPQYCVLHSIMK
jgi:hypothetical protein